MKVIRVYVTWDPEAEVHSARSDDIPGLVVEADTLQEIVKMVSVLAPQLLQENAKFMENVTDTTDIPYHIIPEPFIINPSHC